MGTSIEFFAALIASGLAASFLMEGWLLSRPLVFWKRGWACNGVHIGLYFVGLGLIMLVTQRVTLAVLLLFLIQLIVIAVSNVKEKTLREPFLSCDFEYFTDAIKHPRLYLPFFGYAKAALLILGGLGVLGAIFYVRKPLTELHSAVSTVLITEASLILLGILLVGLSRKHLPPMTLEPLADLKRCGLLAYLYAYRQLERDLSIKGILPFAADPEVSIDGLKTLPDLVSIQVESFFDPRPVFSCLKRDLLPNWDQLCVESAAHGTLDTGHWGANTVRPEFEFLTGLSSDQIGVHQFQPYRALARKTLPSMASWLKKLGYQTVAIHPYPKSFYGRDRVYPNLGFDELIDISAFEGATFAGGYVSDVALGEFVSKLLAQPSEKPRYIHVITMENHGPYDIWSDLEDTVNPLQNRIPESCDELEVYARHLQNSDRLFGIVAKTLAQQSKLGALCIFGDHVPILNKAYQMLGEPDGQTNYLIWSPQSGNQTMPQQSMRVEHLSRAFLKAAGLPAPEVF